MKAKPLPPLLPIREERLHGRVPLAALAYESRIPLATLSLAERGMRVLSPDAEKRRRAALARLAATEAR